MDLILVYALALKIGTLSAPGAQTYQWEVLYPQTGGPSEFYTTTAPWLEFQPAYGWMLRSRVRGAFSGAFGPWSDWSSDFVVNPLPGDVDGDCAVGAPDVVEVGQNWARRCDP